MSSVLTRNVALFGGMIVAGFICVQAVPFMRSMRGSGGPTVFIAEQPMVAAGALAAVLGLTAIVACIVGRMVNAAAGLFVLGAGVFALDSRLATVRSLVFADLDRSAMTMTAAETLLLAIFGLLLTLVVFRVTGGLHDIEPDEQNQRPHWLWSSAAIKSAASGALVLPAVWLIAQSPLKGQALAAAIVGGMLAGLVARLVSPHVQPILIFVSPMIFGAVGHVLAAATSPTPIDHAYIGGSLSVFARVLPLDYLAGSLLGVSMGLGWAKSFLHHEQTAAAPARS